MKVRISGGTHTGLVRRRNDDRFGATGLSSSQVDGEVSSAIVGGGSCLAVVADGLGGHPCGDTASRLAVDYLLRCDPDTADALVIGFLEANEVIYDAMSCEDGTMTMGTVAVAALVTEQGLVVVNVGDSTVFEFVDDGLVQLSIDDVPTRGPSSVVTQTLGGGWEFEEIEPHLYEDALGPRRRVLLCSDGLTNFVSQDRICQTLRALDGTAAVERLIHLALDAGGRDNVTVVLLEPAG